MERFGEQRLKSTKVLQTFPLEVTEERKNAVKKRILANIKERITSNSVDTFPEDTFVRLERNGLWDNVLEYLNKPGDITSAYFCCPSFGNLLEEERQVVLLPAVLQTLSDNEKCRQSSRNERLDNALLNLRLAFVGNRKWGGGLDKYIFEQGFSKPDWYLTPSKSFYESQSRHCHRSFRTSSCVDRAMNILSRTTTRRNANSLIRIIQVNTFVSTEPNIVHEKMMQFLKAHGDALWGFKYLGNNYEQLQTFLMQTPHLKGFILSMSAQHEELSRLQLKIMENPFPTLKTLEYFELHYYGKEHEFLVEEILRKSVNLKSVKFWYDKGIMSDTVMSALQNLNLECLELRNWHPQFYLELLNQLTTVPLKVLRLKNFPREELALYLKTQANKLISILNQFHSTLHELRIDMFHFNGGLQLPHLKILEIQSVDCNCNNLSSLGSLEKLVVGKKDGLQETNVIQLFTILPNLEEIEVKGSKLNYVRRGRTIEKYALNVDGNDAFPLM